MADLKAFSALGAYGMAVITAVTAQSTTGVSAVHELPAAVVGAQIDTLFADVRVDAVKIGMLANAEIIATVAAALDRHRPPHVVLDPVMVSKSGHRLLAPDAVRVLREELLGRVDLVTPNVPEAADLLGEPQARDVAAMEDQARRLCALGARGALCTGGHLDGCESTDVLVANGITSRLGVARVSTRNDHGTGCTLSAAIAALRPRHQEWLETVRAAKAYLTASLAAAGELEIGHGRGPVHHFHALWPSATPVAP